MSSTLASMIMSRVAKRGSQKVAGISIVVLLLFKLPMASRFLTGPDVVTIAPNREHHSNGHLKFQLQVAVKSFLRGEA